MAARVAVVGGGITGSVCASMLRAMGAEVKLFDKGGRLGGRASGRVVASSGEPPLSFDHGVQFFRGQDPALRPLLGSPLFADLLAEWDGRFGVLGPRGGLLPTSAVRVALGARGGSLLKDRAAPAASDPDGPTEYGSDVEQQASDEDDEAARSLAELDFCGFLEGEGPLLVGAAAAKSPWHELCARTDVEVATRTAVLDLARSGGRWQLTTAPVGEGGSPAVEEAFDHVVVATHSSELGVAALSHLLEQHTDEHSAPFVPALTELVGKLQDLEREPVYTVMAGYEQALGAVPFEAAVPHGCTTLRWISRDSSKYAPDWPLLACTRRQSRCIHH